MNGTEESAPKAGRAKEFVRIALSLAMAGAVIWLFADQWETLAPVLWNADPGWIAAGAFLLLVSYYFRALRFQRLSEGKLKLWPEGYAVTGIHGVLTYFLPMRVGELALPALLRSSCGTGWAEGLHILLHSRVLDLCALGICILAGATVIPTGLSGSTRLIWFLCGAGMTVSPFVVAFLARLHRLRPAWLFRHVHHLARYGRVDVHGLGTSLGVWVFMGGILYCAAEALGMNLKPGDVLFLSTVQLPLQISPVQGLASTGSHEAGWAGALMILGRDAAEALRFALAAHVVIVFDVLVLGVVSGAMTLWIRFSGRAPSARDGA